MNKNFIDYLRQLFDEVCYLNKLLLDDQKILPTRDTDRIEKGNINKLDAKNRIDDYILSIQSHPEWYLFEAELNRTNHEESSYLPAIQLWFETQKATEETQRLIQVNQTVVQSSLSYYIQLFQKLVESAGDNHQDLVYDKVHQNSE